mmetsp:Transcript_57581/g.125241  ORF Transcript_57581/g.125241 Transcript_57581/m.125241 type:complete len:227 (-) Transcript_57581:152-832(-)
MCCDGVAAILKATHRLRLAADIGSSWYYSRPASAMAADEAQEMCCEGQPREMCREGSHKAGQRPPCAGLNGRPATPFPCGSYGEELEAVLEEEPEEPELEPRSAPRSAPAEMKRFQEQSEEQRFMRKAVSWGKATFLSPNPMLALFHHHADDDDNECRRIASARAEPGVDDEEAREVLNRWSLRAEQKNVRRSLTSQCLTSRNELVPLSPLSQSISPLLLRRGKLG